VSEAIVIIGSGLAGITVARELRRIDRDLPVVIVTADDGGFYSKPSLSNALAAGKNAAQLLLTPPAQLASQLGVELRVHTRVERILPAERLLQTSAGPLPYRKLVLAQGAMPIRLPLRGDGAGRVLSVNNLADYAAFRDALDGKTRVARVAILGAGLIGCEFANDLRAAGIAVDVFDLAPQPLGRLLPPRAAAFFRDRLESAGVRFHLSTGSTEVWEEGSGFRLFDGQGGQHSADLVLSAVGLQPAVELAQAAGLAVGRGIRVDRTLASSGPDIHALGDCAEIDGRVLPFVMPIMQAARALAKTLAGDPTEVGYPAMPVVVKTPACPAVVCPPPADAQGSWREEADEGGKGGEGGIKALFEDASGTALGFALVGEAVREKQALAARMPAWL